MKVCIAGGAGYVGSKLVPKMIAMGYHVVVLDLYLFGEDIFEPYHNHPRLTEIKADIRDLGKVAEALEGCECVIHLACISNDPSFELNPLLGKSINFDAFEPFVKIAKEKGIKKFIYASSSSVYGVKSDPFVTEDATLEPLTDYSKFKAACEEILFKYMSDDFTCVVLRPATVCGYAPRQRLDVIVNILTNHAYHKGKIKVMGGKQKRPNIHIDDMVESYLAVLEAPSKLIQGKRYNVGANNHTVGELGSMVAAVVGNCEIEKVPTNDERSYHICSNKIKKELGFVPKRTIEDAVSDLLGAFQEGLLPDSMDDARYFNIKKMQSVNL